MAIIDYKQKIKDYMNSSEVDTLYKSMLINLFPELAESEDERIRKEIINYFEHHPNIIVKRERKRDWIAWLEKQSKDSPVLSNSSNTGKYFWSEEDEENLNWFEKFFRAESVIAEGKDIPQDRYLWFKNLKDRVQSQNTWKPSFQQMKQLKWIADQNKDNMLGKELMTLYDDLKKLRGE